MLNQIEDKFRRVTTEFRYVGIDYENENNQSGRNYVKLCNRYARYSTKVGGSGRGIINLSIIPTEIVTTIIIIIIIVANIIISLLFPIIFMFSFNRPNV